MPILRLAYTTLFLIALIAIFVLWAQVGGQSHLDLLPWFVKLGLGVAAAWSIVRATSAAVAGERGWNGQSMRWLGVTLAVMFLCGMATYYAHMYLEDDDEQDQPQDTTVSRMVEQRDRPRRPVSQLA
ncbi:MAG TPA: hypothetical protein VGF49_10245 [Candidatus Solibacter sp.]|jgi:hypothetical protein